VSKVYVLIEHDLHSRSKTNETVIGVITNENVLNRWIDSDPDDSPVMRVHKTFELNDPELLNRIAKESEYKK